MTEIKWSPQLSLGLKSIDEQHKELIRITNTLIRGIKNQQEQKIIDITIKSLRKYTVEHFKSEEKYMEEISYPQLSEHKNQHRNLAQEVKNYQDRIYRKETVTPEEIKLFLRDWLIKHIIYSDLNIAKFLNNKKTA